MRINAQIEQSAVRSAPRTSDEVRALVDTLWAARKDSRWSKYIFDGRVTDTKDDDDPDAVLDFHPRRLTTLDHFRVCNVNERLWQIVLKCHCQYSESSVRSVVEFFRAKAPAYLRRMTVGWFVSQSGTRANNIYGEFWLQISGDFQGEQPVFTFSVIDFRKGDSVDSRLEFFDEAIDCLGLRGQLAITRNVAAYRMDVAAVPPWQLGGRDADLKGWNPSSFYAKAPIDFDDAWSRMDSALRSRMVKRIDNMTFSIRVRPDMYAQVYEKLDSLAANWSVSIDGSYADGIDPYTADAAQSPDGRFPIFTWVPMEEHQGVFFQADIVPTPKGPLLEIHSNCGDMRRLLNEAESATGAQFTPVQSTSQ